MSVTINIYHLMLCGTVLAIGFLMGAIVITATSDMVRSLIYGWLDRQALHEKGDGYRPSE